MVPLIMGLFPLLTVALALQLVSVEPLIGTAPERIDQEMSNPFQLAIVEGVIRRQLYSCPFSSVEREYAMELSRRMVATLLLRYRVSADEVNAAVRHGEDFAGATAGSRREEPCHRHTVRQCLLLLLGML